MSLSKEDILAVNKADMAEVEVPAWKGTVWLRSIPLGSVLPLLEIEHPFAMTLALLREGVCDANGKPILTEQDVNQLRCDDKTIKALASRLIELNPMFATEGHNEGN